MTGSGVNDVAERGQGKLAAGSIGLWAVIFVSVTTMAPAAGAAFSITVGAGFAGSALPLAVFVALLGCMFTAMSMAQMAKHLPSAGGMATYIARGLGGWAGFLAGWVFNLAYALVVPLVTVLFGDLLGSTLNTEYGWNFHFWWIAGSVFCAAVVGILNYFGIHATTRFGIILGSFEILVMIALSVTLIAKGHHNSIKVFSTHFANVPGFHGVSGIIAGSVYGVLAFIGFDAAAPLAEETRNPRRTVGRAVIGAAVLIGLFFVFTTYAATAYFGPDKFAGFAAAGNGNPWNLMATAVWGGGWVVLFIALLNSSLACANGGGSAACRCIWSMARIRVIPSILGRTHPRWKSPSSAVILVFSLGLILTIWFGEKYTPIVAFAVFGTIITGLILPIYIFVNIACIAYYWRERRSEFNIIKHGVVPILGVVLFVPGFFTALGITIFSFISPLTYPISIASYVIAAWYGIGVILAIYFGIRHKDRIADTARVFLDEDEDDNESQDLAGTRA